MALSLHCPEELVLACPIPFARPESGVRFRRRAGSAAACLLRFIDAPRHGLRHLHREEAARVRLSPGRVAHGQTAGPGRAPNQAGEVGCGPGPLDWLSRARQPHGDGEAVGWNEMVEARGREPREPLRGNLRRPRVRPPRQGAPPAETGSPLAPRNRAGLHAGAFAAPKGGLHEHRGRLRRWHVPALVDMPPQKADLELLKGARR